MSKWKVALLASVGVLCATAPLKAVAQNVLTEPKNVRPPLFSPTAAPVFTPFGSVVALQAGWVDDQVLVFHSVNPMTNPDGCTVVTNGYITNPADPGHNLFHSMLLSALLNRREVAMVISGCFLDRPRIVSVSIR